MRKKNTGVILSQGWPALLKEHPLPQRILLVRLSSIGDCIHALPMINALRDQLPDAHLGWAIQSAAHQLLEGHPAVDRFHLYPRSVKGPRSTFREMRRLRRELRRERYEVALDVQGLTKSGLVAWMSGAPRRIGFAGAESREANRLFVNHRVAVGDPMHVVDRNLELLRALDLEKPREISWSLPVAPLEEGFERMLREELRAAPFAVVNPGTTWETKRWPPERFAEVCRALAERHDLAVLVSWGNERESAEADRIVQGCSGLPVFRAPGTSLPELASLLSQARLFVGNDTGPMHLAVALGVPVVAIFGASDPKRNGPYGASTMESASSSSSAEPRAIALTSPQKLDCRPCLKGSCARGDLACLRGLESEIVVGACARILAAV